MLARWNPWQELSDLEREMSDLTRRFFGTGWVRSATRRENGKMWMPAVDVLSRDGDLVVRAEIPGVNPEKDVDISFQDGVLMIRGERRYQEESEKEDYYRFESLHGSFERSIPLPADVKPEAIKASYENGILEVIVPHAAELAAAKKIPVRVGGSPKALTTKGSKK